MITQLSKWLLYVASYKWIYILQMASIVISSITRSTDIAWNERIIVALKSNALLLLCLIILFLFSVIYTKSISKWKNNTRIHYRIENEKTVDGGFLLIPLAATTLTISLTAYGIIVTVFVFVAMGCVFSLAGYVYALPIFFLRGYHVYGANSGNIKIITRLSEEEYRIRQDQSLDGIEARELIKNTYIIL